MAKRFPNLSSPLIVGGHLLKNRLYFPNALPKTQQGPETFPADPIISFYANIAKNGAAVICYADMSSTQQRSAFNGDERHFPMYDISDPSVENYISQVADNVHYYGSKIVVDVSAGNTMHEYDVVDGAADDLPPKDLDHEIHIAEMKPPRKAMTEEHMEQMIQLAVEKASYYQRLGFDGGYVGAFQGKLGNFLSSVKNTRQDDYGGTFENRSRFPLRLLQRVRAAVGTQFMLILDVNRLSPDMPEDEVMAFIKLAQPYIDLIFMRPVQIQTAFEGGEETYLHPVSLEMSAHVKAEGIEKPVVSWTGFQSLDLMEDAIVSGKTDMIAAGRLMICNENLGEILREERSEDLTPCLLCNRCHGDTLVGPWLAVCSVNPTIGFSSRIERIVTEPGPLKRVAVVGGGPAGMAAAIRLRQRGHFVTLYEATGSLGGQIQTARYPAFKWPLKRYLDYLIGQVIKSEVDVRMNSPVTPEQIAAGNYDAVVVAVGADPQKPNIPGAMESEILNPLQVYGHEQELGHNVVCIGGAETSTETALYLAQQGHDVILLCRKKRIAYNANPIHYVDELRAACDAEKNLHIFTFATTTQIEENMVTFRDANNQLHELEADSIVAAGGMKPRMEQATAFYGSAGSFFAIGDCTGAGNLQKCNRQAFAAVNQIR